jgi:hypothetical protein
MPRHSQNVRLLPKHALTIVLVFTVLVELCPNAHAQQTTTYNDEAEWKTAYLSAQATGAAGTNKRIVGGMFLGGAGLLTALAALHTTTTPPFRCFVPPCSMPSRDATTERHLQVGLLTAGIGAGVTGIGLLFKGTSQKKKGDMQLRQLEDIGRQHGWRISLEPDFGFKRLQARATYSW